MDMCFYLPSVREQCPRSLDMGRRTQAAGLLDPSLDLLETRDAAGTLDLSVDDQAGRREDPVGHHLLDVGDLLDVGSDRQARPARSSRVFRPLRTSGIPGPRTLISIL